MTTRGPVNEELEAGAASGIVRPYRSGDEDALSEVCLKTGDSGKDATGRFDDDELLAHVYLLPYLALEPELAFVLDIDGRAVGYIVGTADSVSFAQRYRRRWLPVFAERYPLTDPALTPTQRLIQVGHHPEHAIGPDHELFPAHLHIDLLPEAQGKGWGRTLMRTLLASLRAAGAPGVQLGVGADNLGARAFYRRLGFTPLPSTPADDLRLAISTDSVL